MHYEFLIVPLIASLSTQFIFKPIIALLSGKFSWKDFLAYGGMPSAHSALVSSLASIIALKNGISSPEFAIAFFLAAIVITDAVGLRSFMTEHSKAINKIIIDLPDEKEYCYKILNERIAHTLSQIIVGSILGFIIAYLYFIL